MPKGPFDLGGRLRHGRTPDSVPAPAEEAAPPTVAPVTPASSSGSTVTTGTPASIPTPGRPSVKKKAARYQATVYLAPADKAVCDSLAYRLKQSGKLQGLVDGQIGLSIVLRVGLEILRQEFEEHPERVLDIAQRVAARR